MNMNALFELDPVNAKLYWKARTPDLFTPSGQRSAEGCCNNWNARYAGRECLTAIGTHGYRWGNVLGKAMLAHRVIFHLSHGFTPDYVDHINGDKLDNRPENLRSATNGENIANSKSRAGSSSKYLGVCWSKNHLKWIANITSHGKCRHLGLFANEDDAALAYNHAAKEIHKSFARLNVI